MPRHHAQNGSNGDHSQSDRGHNNGQPPSRSRLNARTKRKDQIDPIDIEIDQGTFTVRIFILTQKFLITKILMKNL